MTCDIILAPNPKIEEIKKSKRKIEEKYKIENRVHYL